MLPWDKNPTIGISRLKGEKKVGTYWYVFAKLSWKMFNSSQQRTRLPAFPHSTLTNKGLKKKVIKKRSLRAKKVFRFNTLKNIILLCSIFVSKLPVRHLLIDLFICHFIFYFANWLLVHLIFVCFLLCVYKLQASLFFNKLKNNLFRGQISWNHWRALLIPTWHWKKQHGTNLCLPWTSYGIPTVVNSPTTLWNPRNPGALCGLVYTIIVRVTVQWPQASFEKIIFDIYITWWL